MNQRLTYIIGVRAEGKLAAMIRQFSDCDVPESDRWIHCGAAYWRKDAWWFIDCDFDAGVREMLLEAFLQELGAEPTAWAGAHPWRFNVNWLRAVIGRPFSKRKLAAFRFAQPVPYEIGLTCGELLARCDYGEACARVQKPADQIRSVDWQIAVQNDKLIGEVLLRPQERQAA